MYHFAWDGTGKIRGSLQGMIRGVYVIFIKTTYAVFLLFIIDLSTGVTRTVKPMPMHDKKKKCFVTNRYETDLISPIIKPSSSTQNNIFSYFVDIKLYSY